ncbi:MAG: carbamoyl-phosphate synthase large subunit [Deltaproteobacteria bacterium]|nr:carbamoyl-phosphate synthase large subunit [Deltaproteobacteria bacterium]
MPMKILVANRGEIAIRIMRAAAALNMPTVAAYSRDDSHCLHTRMGDEAYMLDGRGPSAYLDMGGIINAALATDCTAIHPGYGFLSENAVFARRCNESGLVFIGPAVESLELFGDKIQARSLARECGIPLLPGTPGAVSLAGARDFFASLEKGTAVMIKAISGGGGRGMRVVSDLAALDEAYRLCRSEAQAAFGNGDVYVERLVEQARHIEVQVIGDGSGGVSHLWERECSLQRCNQKVIEVAPSPTLSEEVRSRLTTAAIDMAGQVRYKSLGTFEFLVDDARFYFLEVNPRLQVEHTVTEEVMGIDLVKAQIRIAGGSTLTDLELEQGTINTPIGYALQARINMEKITPDGHIRPSGGTLRYFDVPSGPGIRVDTFGYTGYTTHQGFDSLLAKLVVRSRDENYADTVAKAYRALCEFRIDGVDTNIPLLQALLTNAHVAANRVSTRFIEEHLETLAGSDPHRHQRKYMDEAAGPGGGPEPLEIDLQSKTEPQPEIAPPPEIDTASGPENCVAVNTVMQGTVVEIEVAEGDPVYEGQSVAVLEAMKMQHLIKTPLSGVVRKIAADVGDTLYDGQPLLFVEPMSVEGLDVRTEETVDLDAIRPDLADVLQRQRAVLDETRAKAVERRHKTGQRTARENIADLVDADTFIEYGSFAVAAQRGRLSAEQLLEKSPADGLVAGIAAINGSLFNEAVARCMVMSYDYMALAGTQGYFNHKKMDRMLKLARERRLPLVLFAEGGGGRPGDIDAGKVQCAGLDFETFAQYARLSGLVPVVGIVSGRCFAGNAALLGCSDVIIATQNAKIGMGGPAMIEGGGLGVCRPDDIGPIEIQSPNGVVDIVVADEAEAVEKAKQYLAYFQGPVPDWDCVDQRELRWLIPENRLRAYDVRTVIDTLADIGTVLELRREFGVGVVAAFIRIEGRPFGLIANNSMHLGGAIDADAADKASRFTQLCDAFDIPLVVLLDTPGFMVGPEAEKSAQVRHFSRMFVTGGNATIPIFSIALRKGYGLGAMAMIGGGFHCPVLNVSWPTGEFGGMGLEGAVRLGFKKELAAESDPEKREALFNSMVAMAYEHGKAVNMASFLEIDGVIDPMETRHWIIRGLRSMPETEQRTGKKRPNIDTW